MICHIASYFDIYDSPIFLVLSSTNKTLRTIDLFFVSKFFQSCGPVGKCMSSQFCRCMNGIIFDIPSGFAPILSWFNATVTVAPLILIHVRESMYDPHRLGLVLWNYRTFNRQNETQIHYHTLFLKLLGNYAEKELKSSAMTLSVFLD